MIKAKEGKILIRDENDEWHWVETKPLFRWDIVLVIIFLLFLSILICL